MLGIRIVIEQAEGEAVSTARVGIYEDSPPTEEEIRVGVVMLAIMDVISSSDESFLNAEQIKVVQKRVDEIKTILALMPEDGLQILPMKGGIH